LFLDCRVICHPDCRELAPLPCIPSVPTPKKKQHVRIYFAYFWVWMYDVLVEAVTSPSGVVHMVMLSDNMW